VGRRSPSGGFDLHTPDANIEPRLLCLLGLFSKVGLTLEKYLSGPSAHCLLGPFL